VLSIEQAWSLLARRLAPLPPERIPVTAAAGHVLAAELVASTAVPPCDVAAMDGYALAGAASAGARLEVAGTIAAGDLPGVVHPGPGLALRIMTGAPMPRGADRVIPVEQTAAAAVTDDPAAAGNAIRLLAAVAAGAHLRYGGEVLRPGAPLLASGQPLTPPALALLASQGITEVMVHRRPRVAALITGDEVVPAEQTPAPGQLRDSHTAFLAAACAEAGVPLEPLGIAPDRPDLLLARLGGGLERNDVLVVTGGVSMGSFDFVEGALAALGVEILFDGVAMQPGKPLVVGTRRRPDGTTQWVFALPGNPGSVMTCAYVFLLPALRCLGGRPDRAWGSAIGGLLATPLPTTGARERFFPARREIRDGAVWLAALTSRGSHDLVAFATADALLRKGADTPPLPAGAPCSWLSLLPPA
jgi:molybdopterin molybdotransferase